MSTDKVTVEIQSKYAVFRWRAKKFCCQLLGVGSPHNDHLVISALLAFCPYFSGSIVEFGLPVSKRLREFLEVSNWKLAFPPGHVDDYKGNTPSLSYSAGIDSTAAAYIMQQGVALYMAHRDGVFRQFALKAIKEIREFGFDARTVHCDVQSVRSPFGFPVDVACSIPCIVNAAAFALDSVCFGTILESAYNIGRGGFRDYAASHHFRFFGGLFAAAGLPFCQLTAGLSEVATLSIQKQSGLSGKSCLRSKQSCGKCYKCLRRLATEGMKPELTASLRRSINTRHHFGILEYALWKHGIRLFSNKVQVKDMRFLERWYSPSIGLIPEKYRDKATSRIQKLVATMDENDISNLKRYHP